MTDAVAQASDATLNAIKELFTAQLGRFGDKVDNLTVSVEKGFGDMRRILDDHETRLREQHKTDAQQGQDISGLRVEIAEMKGDLRTMKEAIGVLTKSQERRVDREMDFWQRAALEAVKLGAFGAAAGGVIVGVLRALGVV
jgi:hypothetical protein